MQKWLLLGLIIGIAILVLLLTWPEDTAPCAPNQAVTGAVLAEDEDQDGLVNRAIIVHGKCDKQKQNQE